MRISRPVRAAMKRARGPRKWFASTKATALMSAARTMKKTASDLRTHFSARRESHELFILH